MCNNEMLPGRSTWVVLYIFRIDSLNKGEASSSTTRRIVGTSCICCKYFLGSDGCLSWGRTQNFGAVDWLMFGPGGLDGRRTERIRKLQYVLKTFRSAYAQWGPLGRLGRNQFNRLSMEFDIKFPLISIIKSPFSNYCCQKVWEKKSISVFAMVFAALRWMACVWCCVLFWAHKSMQFGKLHL